MGREKKEISECLGLRLERSVNGKGLAWERIPNPKNTSPLNSATSRGAKPGGTRDEGAGNSNGRNALRALGSRTWPPFLKGPWTECN